MYDAWLEYMYMSFICNICIFKGNKVKLIDITYIAALVTLDFSQCLL